MTRRRFTLVLVDVARPGDVSPYVRLRRFLKQALRSWEFRCTDIREMHSSPPNNVQTPSRDTTMPPLDVQLAEALDTLARDLDRVAAIVVELDQAERQRLLLRLHRLSAGLQAAYDDIGPAHAEPARTH